MNLLNSRRRYFSFLLENHTDTHTAAAAAAAAAPH